MQLLEAICNYESNTNQCIRKIQLKRLFAETPLDKSRLMDSSYSVLGIGKVHQQLCKFYITFISDETEKCLGFK